MTNGRSQSARNWGGAVFDRIALAVLALVMVAQAAYVIQAIAIAPVLRQPMADSRAYVEWARAIAGGHWSAGTPFYRAPLYPYLIAPLYAVAEAPEVAIVVLQALMGIALGVLCWRISRRLYGPAAGAVSLALFGLFGPVAAQETKILGTSGGMLLGLLALWRLLSARGTRAHFAGGILLGLGALARPNAILVAAGTLLIAASHRSPGAPRFRAPLAILAGLVLAIAPATLHNLAAGDLVAISSNGGMTFFHGNNEESRDGLLEPPARIGAYGNAVDQEQLDRRIASAELGRTLRASESSAHWLGEGVRFLAGHPAAWARLWGAKIVRFVGVHDYADNYSFAVERAQTSFLRLFIVPFPLILIPAVAGLVLRRPRGREEALLLLFASLGFLTCLLFYVGSRYRSESVPALAILAGRAVVVLRDAGTRRRWAAGALAAALAALALIPPGAPAASQDAMAAAQWAAALERDARPDEALRVYRWGALRYPKLDIAWARWADLEEEGGGPLAGAEVLSRGIAAGADGRMLRTHRGVMLARAGREEDAESDYRIALRFAPGDPAASLNLGLLLVRLGRDGEAGAFLDLPELRGNPEALYQRGLIAVRAGRMDEANRILDASIAASASDPRPGLLRAVAWIRQGRGDQALAWVRAWLGRIGVGEIDLDREARQVIDALGCTGSSDEVIGRAQTGTPADKAWDAVRAVRETLAGATLR